MKTTILDRGDTGMKYYKGVVFLCVLMAGPLLAEPDVTARPTDGEDLQTVELHKALDKNVDFGVEDMAIEAMFEKLGKATGVTFAVSKETLDLLPGGSRTLFAVKFQAVRLRDALTKMLSA
ncbi:MAG TPA: hypothetical protein ENL03_06245, partial [Phycisphaerae bacterium]|nr:hypothetical protein [Phycisphaerae bacterium]